MLQSAYISIISGASLWGLIALFFKFLTACGFSPLQIVALRVLFAAVLMTAVIFKIDPKLLKIRWRDSWLFIGTGIFSLVFFNYCYFRSIESSSISIAVLLLYTAPVFVMLLSIFLFREKFTRCKMLALLSTFCGCTFITGIFSSKMTLTLEAFGFGLASGIGYALYSSVTTHLQLPLTHFILRPSPHYLWLNHYSFSPCLQICVLLSVPLP